MWAFGYLAFLLAAAWIAASSPIAFQKANVVTPSTPRGVPDLIVSTPLDADKVVGDIPYRGGEVWAVKPSAKYEATILGGSGNCATKTLGLAHYLGENGIDYQIIDLMHSGTFLAGIGHTLMRVAYRHNGQERVGLIDMLEGGLPTDGERYFDVADLTDGAIPNAKVDPLNERKDDHARYFGAFLDGVVIGYRSAADVNRYHGFVDSIYVPLGHEKLEKYVYDGVSLIFGYLPSLQVTEYERMLEDIGPTIYLHRFALWTLRSALVVFPLMFVIGWRQHHSARREQVAAGSIRP
ncbi:MAG: hypothetical protein AAF543_11215 [Pseudomonadota bacterium]